jgi:hypothetical protein
MALPLSNDDLEPDVDVGAMVDIGDASDEMRDRAELVALDSLPGDEGS